MSVMAPHKFVNMPLYQDYARPELSVVQDETVLTENDLVWFAAIGWVLLVFGSAWAYCKATCGWRGVQECSTSWLQVKAVCK